MAAVRSPTWRWAELPVVALAAALLALGVNTFVAQAFYIPSASMVPQLQLNDRVVVSKLAYHLHPPRRGDLVVFEAPQLEQQAGGQSANPFSRAMRAVVRGLGLAESKTEVVKRVLALPGRAWPGGGGGSHVDRQRLEEPYLPLGTATSDSGPVLVPPGVYG